MSQLEMVSDVTKEEKGVPCSGSCSSLSSFMLLRMFSATFLHTSMPGARNLF